MADLLALVTLGLVPGRLLTTPFGLAILASLTALSAIAFCNDAEVRQAPYRGLPDLQRLGQPRM